MIYLIVFDPMRMHPEHTYTTYTKHYYIGSERINSKLGTVNNLGVLCEEMEPSTDLINEMNERAHGANKWLEKLYHYLDKELEINAPYLYSTNHSFVCGFKAHNPKLYDAYWYHPDHLGSSSFITNTTGEISQHMEYLPFGETLVEEHLNSHNSPFKFNAKEYDAETGNYYYGARYYDPKWSTFLTPDPALESYPGISPYAYTLNNPVRYVDPTGMYVEDYIDVTKNKDGTYTVVGGEANADKSIYIVNNASDRQRTGEILDIELFSEYSFHRDDGSAVIGTIINLNDQTGQSFYDKTKNVGLFEYMGNATGGEPFDFKRDGTKLGDKNYDNPLYHYRGMLINGNIGSARDVGNTTAGYIAGIYGFSWYLSRKAFDALETQQRYDTWNFIKWESWEIEGQPTQQAQRAGHNEGYQIYKQKQIEREWQRQTRYPTPGDLKY